jgi:hypothetical protein
MRSLKNISFLLFIGVLVSCTKVIDIKLRDSETKYVIEGIITDQPGYCKVHVSQTKNFNGDNDFTNIDEAVVKIMDNGNAVPLVRSEPGVYETTLINGIPGHLYELSVEVNGSVFTSSCIMPEPVEIDSLYISRGPFGQFKFATLKYVDRPSTDNGYRFIQYVNGAKEPTIFWDDDEFTDGNTIITQLDASAQETDDPRNIKSGDEVTVEMLTIDELVLKYWRSLRSDGGTGEGSSAAPANPITNIEGGALGYFSAHTVRRKTVISP